MFLFVKSGRKDRRVKLDAHFSDRGIYEYFDDVFWIDQYGPDDPFVIWVQKTKAPNLTREQVSGTIKTYYICKMICESASDTDMFMHVDDDVCFIENWKDGVPKNIDFVHITSLGVNYHVRPGTQFVHTGNIGGCECVVFTKKFARFFLDNVDFNGQAQDILIGAMMAHHGLPLGVTPICQQTSILGDVTNSPPKYEKDWITFTKTYRPSGISFDSVLKEYQEFMMRKKFVEQDFFEKYGVKVDIWNPEYIAVRYMVLQDPRAQ